MPHLSPYARGCIVKSKRSAACRVWGLLCTSAAALWATGLGTANGRFRTLRAWHNSSNFTHLSTGKKKPRSLSENVENMKQ